MFQRLGFSCYLDAIKSSFFYRCYERTVIIIIKIFPFPIFYATNRSQYKYFFFIHCPKKPNNLVQLLHWLFCCLCCSNNRFIAYVSLVRFSLDQLKLLSTQTFPHISVILIFVIICGEEEKMGLHCRM